MREWLKKYDVLTKALSVLIAIVLWFYVVNVLDPVTDTEIKNIKPVFIGSDELMNAKNLMVSDQDQFKISVVVSGKRQELATVNSDEIRIEVDVSKIKEAGTYKLPYTVILPSDNMSVLKKTPQQLEVKLDKVVTAVVPVKVEMKGSIAEGYMTGEITTIPSGVSIIGLQDDIAKVSYAQVKVTKTGINASISEPMKFDFYDVAGQLLHLKSVKTESDTVEVNIPVLKVVDLPLTVEIVEGGGALKQNFKYTIEPNNITVAGDEKVIGALESIKIGVIDLSKVSGTSNSTFVISLPENLKNISGETSANVKYEIIGLNSKTMQTTSIEIVNVPNGYDIKPITNRLNINIRGTGDGLSKLLPENIHAVADLSATVLSPGRHTIPVSIKIDGVTGVGAVGDYKIVVRVTKT